MGEKAIFLRPFDLNGDLCTYNNRIFESLKANNIVDCIIAGEVVYQKF